MSAAESATGPVLLVRAQGGDDGDAPALTALDIDVIEDPYLVVAPCTDPGARQRAASVLDAVRRDADLLLLTSRAAVRALDAIVGRPALVESVREGVARGLRGAAVGPSTAAALRDLGLTDVLEPAVATSRGLLAALRERQATEPGRIRRAVLPCGAQAMKGLGEGLGAEGWQVDEVVVYTTEPVGHVPPSVTDLAAGRIPVVVVRSPTAVHAIARHVPALPAGTIVVCGGPTTATAVASTWGISPVVSDGPSADEVARSVAAVLGDAAAGSAASSRPKGGTGR
jgi:uroporphyrinogen-III synthase